MISCNKCKFVINKNMKYCLKNNICPACGTSVMNNEDLRISKNISGQLLKAGFSESIFELSIFIMQNFLKSEDNGGSSNSNEEFVESEVAGEKDELDEDFADQQFHGQDFHEEEELEEEELDRVERLKKLARNNLIKSKKGVSVRRVGADD